MSKIDELNNDLEALITRCKATDVKIRSMRELEEVQKMSELNQELELYKLVKNDVSEFGWINDEEFLVWLYHFELKDFIENIVKIFGDVFNDEVAVEAHIRKDYIVIDLACMLSSEDIDLERVFPKEEYKH